MAKVSDIMSSPVWCVRRDDHLAHARKEMINRGVTKLVVVEDGTTPVGVVTVTDLLGTVEGGETPSRRSQGPDGVVDDVMTTRLATVERGAPVPTVARELARRDIGVAPVVEGHELYGIVTPSDILPAIASTLEGRSTVKDVMSRDFARVHRHDSAAKVAERLKESGARAAIVVESGSDDRMVGMVTRESLVLGSAFETHPNRQRKGDGKRLTEVRKRESGGRKDARHVDTVHGAAEDLMLTDVATVDPRDDWTTVANVFAHDGGRALPVLEGDAVVGLVTRRDLLRAFTRAVA